MKNKTADACIDMGIQYLQEAIKKDPSDWVTNRALWKAIGIIGSLRTSIHFRKYQEDKK